jgi:predicted dehydrogenase
MNASIPRASRQPSGLPRRQFLAVTAAVASGAWLNPVQSAAAPSSSGKVYRAAIIGRTGAGDYGHGYDQIFQGLADVSVEAIADADATGLQKAAARSGAKRPHRDFREMLDKERPELVCIASRQPDCHKEMALAASEVCRGIFMEKPFTETLAAADAILAAAGKRQVKILVAHNRRYTSEFLRAKALLEQGLIGRVRLIQIHGKQDSRAGGEDLIVLGTHDFDFLRFCFGDPLWCSASVTVGGRDITAGDVRRGHEPMLVAGDTVHATFAFARNPVAHWGSVTTGDRWNTKFSDRENWAFEIHGTKGILAYQSGFGFAWLDSPFLAHRNDAVRWQELPAPADWHVPEHLSHPIRNLVHAIETDTAPVCSGDDGRWAIEMVAAVYQSQKGRARMSFPLTDRRNPLLSMG